MSTNQSLWSSLKDNPIIVVLGFCAATAAATASVYEKVIVPHQLKAQEGKLSDVTRQLADMPKLEMAVADRDTMIAKLRQELSIARQRVLELSKENVFSVDDPYPKSLRRVRIGDPFSKVDEIYPGKARKSDPDDPFVSVEVEDFFFRSVTFYYDESAKPRRVTHILFHLNADAGGESKAFTSVADVKAHLESQSAGFVAALKSQLVDRYGPGKAVKRATVWQVRGLKLELSENGTLHVDRI